MGIHFEDPFAVPIGRRDPVRRLRGRLVAPVTIVTAGSEPPAGLTVSSVLVVEGHPPRATVLVGAGSDLVEAIQATEAFLVQILAGGAERLAEVFAGLRPSPGGMFASTETRDTRWGPMLADVGDWAGCRLEEIRPLGDQLLVVGEIQEVGVAELADPLIYFRGSYRRLAP